MDSLYLLEKGIDVYNDYFNQITENESISRLCNTLAQQAIAVTFARWSKIFMLGEVEKPSPYFCTQKREIPITASFYYFDIDRNQFMRGIDEHIKYTSHDKTKNRMAAEQIQ